jgi:hypothetical protein
MIWNFQLDITKTALSLLEMNKTANSNEETFFSGVANNPHMTKK